MGLVKTRRLAAMQNQQRAKAGIKLPVRVPLGVCGTLGESTLPSKWFLTQLEGVS